MAKNFAGTVKVCHLFPVAQFISRCVQETGGFVKLRRDQDNRFVQSLLLLDSWCWKTMGFGCVLSEPVLQQVKGRRAFGFLSLLSKSKSTRDISETKMNRGRNTTVLAGISEVM